MSHPYFVFGAQPSGFLLPTTAGGAATYICNVNVTSPNWQGMAEAWAEYGMWEAEAMLLSSGRLARIWMTRPMVKRFRRAFGKRVAVSREQRIAMCGLMMAMCQDDGNAAMNGAPNPASSPEGETR